MRLLIALALAAALPALAGCAGEDAAAPAAEKAAAKPEPTSPAPPPAGLSAEEAQTIMQPPPKPPVTEQTVPEFQHLEGAGKAPPAGAQEQTAVAAPGQRPALPSGTVRVAVLHRQGQEQAAIGVATVIDTYQNANLSEAVGKPIHVEFISRINQTAPPGNLVRYREGNLKAALQLATVLPGDQVVEPMSNEEASRSSVDVMIYLGPSLP